MSSVTLAISRIEIWVNYFKFPRRSELFTCGFMGISSESSLLDDPSPWLCEFICQKVVQLDISLNYIQVSAIGLLFLILCSELAPIDWWLEALEFVFDCSCCLLFPHVFTSSLRNDAHPFMVITWWSLILITCFCIFAYFFFICFVYTSSLLSFASLYWYSGSSLQLHCAKREYPYKYAQYVQYAKYVGYRVFVVYAGYCRQLQFSKCMEYEVQCMRTICQHRVNAAMLLCACLWATLLEIGGFDSGLILCFDSCPSNFRYLLPVNLGWQMNLSIMATEYQ